MRSVPLWSPITLSLIAGVVACGSDDELGREHEFRTPTGRAGSGGSSAGGATSAGASGTAGRAGASSAGGGGGGGGSGGAEPDYGPPEVESMTPSEGPYGTTVTITGKWLGSPARTGVALSLGDSGEVLLDPDSDVGIESWTEDSIVFRYPFPADGAVSVETPQGAAEAGGFAPTWISALTAATAPTASVVASISTAPGSITLLFDTTPPTLLELSPGGTVEHEVDLGGAELASVKLYLTPGGVLEGVGVSTGGTRQLVRLTNVGGDLVGASTGVALGATEYALAGGPDGAAAWMRQSTGWMRARPGKSGAWAVDKGPVADPQPNGKNRASGASSDGSLYIAWAIDTGNFLDDMEAPVFRRLGPSDTAFAAQRSAGSNVDDYVTSLSLFSKGRGLVVRYCGSDVDPSGLSGTSYHCYDALHAQRGGGITRVPVDRSSSTHAFADARAVAGSCGGDRTFRLRTDADVQTDPAVPLGEAVVYPCQTTVALEVDPDGEFVPVVRQGAILHLLARRPAD